MHCSQTYIKIENTERKNIDQILSKKQSKKNKRKKLQVNIRKIKRFKIVCISFNTYKIYKCRV